MGTTQCSHIVKTKKNCRMKLIYTDLFHDSPDSYSCNKSCDNCKKKSLKSIDITDAAKTLIELVKEEPLSEGPLKQKFMSSKNKNNIKESQFASFLMTLTLGGYLKEQIRKIKYISVKYKVGKVEIPKDKPIVMYEQPPVSPNIKKDSNDNQRWAVKDILDQKWTKV